LKSPWHEKSQWLVAFNASGAAAAVASSPCTLTRIPGAKSFSTNATSIGVKGRSPVDGSEAWGGSIVAASVERSEAWRDLPQRDGELTGPAGLELSKRARRIAELGHRKGRLRADR
jgi:hypothetical protein